MEDLYNVFFEGFVFLCQAATLTTFESLINKPAITSGDEKGEKLIYIAVPSVKTQRVTSTTSRSLFYFPSQNGALISLAACI